MSESAREFLNAFDRLAEADQRLVAFEILKRTASFNYPELDDETLIRLAEERFLEMDAEEAANGQA